MEAINKTLKSILKIKLDVTKGFGQTNYQIFFWAYCSITWTTIGKTSFINYEVETMITVEVGLDSPRKLNFNEEQTRIKFMAGGKERGYSNETHNILKENGKVFWFRSSSKIYKVGSLVLNLFFITNKEIKSNSLCLYWQVLHTMVEMITS